MEATKREILVAADHTRTGQYVGVESTPTGQGVEALKDIVFGSVRIVTPPSFWLGPVSSRQDFSHAVHFRERSLTTR